MYKKLFASMAFAALLLALFLPSSEAFAATKKKRAKREYWKPFAQVIDEDETEEDCADCGEEEEEEEEPACSKDTWTCGLWSACSAEGSQTRTCKMTFDCKLASTGSPATSQKCTPPVDDTKKAEEEAAAAAAKKAAAEEARRASAAEAAAKKAAEDEAAAKAAEEAKAAEAAKAAEREKQLEAERARKAAEDAAARPKVDEDAARLKAKKEAALEAEQEAKALEAAKAAEEEAKKKAEEEEHLRKAAEEAARLEAAEKLRQAEETARKYQEELARVIQQNEAFRKIIETLPPPAAPPITDINSNGIADNLEREIGIDTKKIDEDLVKVKAELVVTKKKLVEEEGKSEEEAKKIVDHEFKKKKVEKRDEVIRKVAEKKFRVKIENRTQGVEEKGYSDEAAVLLGVDPREKQKEQESFSPLEKKLFGVDVKKRPEAVEQKCTTSIQHGTVLSSDGFTVLAACPKNKPFTLVAINERGEEIPLETKNSSDNNKMVFAHDRQMPPGNYVMQVRPASPQAFSFAWFASALNADAAPGAESDPVLVNVTQTSDVPQPDVKQIENVEVAGVRDVKVTETADGKIRVTGLTDITTMVVGTFESAVFTSAILADVSTGAFEVVSPRKLDSGDHGVVIYATRVEDSLQSKPVKMEFSIIPRGEAPAAVETGAARPVAITTQETQKKFPLVPVLIFGGVAVLFIGIGLFLKGKKAG